MPFQFKTAEGTQGVLADDQEVRITRDGKRFEGMSRDLRIGDAFILVNRTNGSTIYAAKPEATALGSYVIANIEKIKDTKKISE